ncbi:28S ribosomal protein S14 mitochondrial [Fasciola gigantica]|uniref:28S ribosomal protein S14, mitochondrial n=1 Tax=Fasciola gigantica TaxID=46835 RepID=A0A504YRX3_FASGI|nr:28S ribosomal protein S14 mitochondrial [Fasciola gigantica]
MFKICGRMTASVIDKALGCFTQRIRASSLLSRIPQSIIHEHRHIPDKTPEHHNNSVVEKLLNEKLCGYPPYQARKIRPGFQDAIMVRDYKRRQVAAHFSNLRIRLNALRKNTILPEEIRDQASLQIASLPRDSHWTRIHSRCVVTSRRRGCKTRWRVSRIIWRRYADYNHLSGVLWACWSSDCQSTRRHMRWPPPNDITVNDYIKKYHRNRAN